MTDAPVILVIQTAFIGDVVLASAVVEKLHHRFPKASIDFLLRKGNENLFREHPFLRRVIIWDKKRSKLLHLAGVIREVRRRQYDYVINLHRYLSSGLITVLSGAKVRIGFDKNPMSRWFDVRVPHRIEPGNHEIDRNQALIAALTDATPSMPRLYPREEEYQWVERFRSADGYVCIAPTSVWFTKQLPAEKWMALIDRLDQSWRVYLLGGQPDRQTCEAIRKGTRHPGVENLAGELTFLESAALMQFARMNYANDSAPIHLASSVNAPMTAVFCSTIPGFGFGPLSETRFVVESGEHLSCRPCGLHGFKSCPQGHFRCATTITTDQLIATVNGAPAP